MLFFSDISQNTPKKAIRKRRLLLGMNSTPGLSAARRAVEGHSSSSMSLPMPFTQPAPTLWWHQRALKLLQFAGEYLWMTKLEMPYHLSKLVPFFWHRLHQKDLRKFWGSLQAMQKQDSGSRLSVPSSSEKESCGSSAAASWTKRLKESARGRALCCHAHHPPQELWIRSSTSPRPPLAATRNWVGTQHPPWEVPAGLAKMQSDLLPPPLLFWYFQIETEVSTGILLNNDGSCDCILWLVKIQINCKWFAFRMHQTAVKNLEYPIISQSRTSPGLPSKSFQIPAANYSNQALLSTH